MGFSCGFVQLFSADAALSSCTFPKRKGRKPFSHGKKNGGMTLLSKKRQ